MVCQRLDRRWGPVAMTAGENPAITKHTLTGFHWGRTRPQSQCENMPLSTSSFLFLFAMVLGRRNGQVMAVHDSSPSSLTPSPIPVMGQNQVIIRAFRRRWSGPTAMGWILNFERPAALALTYFQPPRGNERNGAVRWMAGFMIGTTVMITGYRHRPSSRPSRR